MPASVMVESDSKGRWIALAAVLVVLVAPFLASAGEMNTKAYRLRVDFAAGTWEIARPDGSPLVGGAPLFTIEFADGARVGPGDMTALVDANDPWRATYSGPRADLTVSIKSDADRVLFSGEVVCKQGVVARVGLPGRFDLRGTPRTRFYWPRVLGVELNGKYLAGSRKTITNYPPAFCDFCSAQIGDTPIHFYRAETEERPRSSRLCIQGGDPPIFWRSHTVYLRQGERWRIPATAVQIGGDLRDALLRYKRDCGLGKPLEQKIAPEMLARWLRMAEAHVPAPSDGGQRFLSELPMPAVAYVTNWMVGGFNRLFPDFLPPNEKFGGEKGFAEFVRAAHEKGHLVRPYVNFTWWCEGWEGRDRKPAPDSKPSPMLAKYGDEALTRDAVGGQRIEEYYHGCYGYTACPGHPLVVERAKEVCATLVDRYGVDMLYEDQLGARRWPLDLNPALANPADYGWALINLGRDAAARCPVAVEFGNDRALEYAVTLNYWALPPLSPITVITGEERAPWSEAEGRSFPYALYLAGGDSIPQILECLDPAWLTWSALLGCRVTLGTLSEALSQGPDHEAVTFLQRLADASGAPCASGPQAGKPRAVGDALLRFEYLKPRVARAVYERHEVVANFSDAPWPLGDGGAVAPEGFDLRAADGLRAGRYAGAGGERILALLIPGAEEAWTLAPGGFEVRIGDRVLRAPAPPAKRIAATHREPQGQTKSQTAIVDFGAGLGEGRLGATGRKALEKAFGAYAPARVTSLGQLDEALGRCRVLVNAQSQCFPVRNLDDWPAAVARLREWVEGGGVWVEAGRWPLWTVAAPDPPGRPDPAAGAESWTTRVIGKAGFENLYGERCWLSRRREKPPQPLPLRVTDLGRATLSSDTIRALESQSPIVTRPPQDFPGALSLCANDDGDYVMVHALGYGAIVRLGGDPIDAAPQALADAVAAILDGRLDLGSPVWRVPLCRQVRTEKAPDAFARP